MAASSGGVGDDPFWSVVRRRQPDVDLVLLPAPDPPPPAQPVDPAALPVLARRLDEDAAALWLSIVDGQDGAQRGRWVGGAVVESVTREARFATRLDAPSARGSLRRLAQLLDAAGWHVLTPPTGLPRVLAGREDFGARQEVLALNVERTGRFALTVRAGSWAPGREVVRSLVWGQP